MQRGLPVGVSAFVGREHERAKVADLVTDARVVTLTGSGGCGKTRLAVEVAGDVASGFSDGACWVDLQGVSEPGLVAPALGGAVGVHERPGQALTDTLAERLHARQLLVVLDNCEHLVEACAELVGALSSACPRLHVLATSRVPLVVEGEATFEVTGLPVPDPDASSASTVAAADAARLFEVRARQVAADFRIGGDNASAVAEICRGLDGIPLAIELDDPERVRGRHLQFHVELAGRAHTGLTGGEPGPWVARLVADLDDLRAAMDWAVQTGDLRGLVDLTEPIVRFWFERGRAGEVHRRMHDAAEKPGAPAEERVRGLMAAAALALAGSEPASAYRSASQAVDVAHVAAVGGALALGLGQRALSGVLSGLSTSEQVEADVEQAVQRAQRCEDASARAYVLAVAGGALLHGRSIDAGCSLFEQAVEVCEAYDLAFQLPAAHAGAVAWLAWSGRLDQTRRHARRAVELSRQVGRPVWEAVGLTGLGAAAVLQAISAERRSGCPRRRPCCGLKPWRDLYTGCGCVTGWPWLPMHPATWKLLGPWPQRSCGSAVVAAAAGTSRSVSGCWACSHTASSATTT